MQSRHKFTKLNDMVSFGVNGRTIHIHVVPKDLHDVLNREGLRQGELELIDALEKIKDMLKTDKRYKHINKVFAVSSIIRKPISRLFTNLDFDVKTLKTEDAKNDVELKNFYSMFKDGKYIGRAQLSREKLFSDEWSKLAEERKETLKGKEKDRFSTSLENQVNVEPTVEELNITGTNTPQKEVKNIE